MDDTLKGKASQVFESLEAKGKADGRVLPAKGATGQLGFTKGGASSGGFDLADQFASAGADAGVFPVDEEEGSRSGGRRSEPGRVDDDPAVSSGEMHPGSSGLGSRAGGGHACTEKQAQEWCDANRGVCEPKLFVEGDKDVVHQAEKLWVRSSLRVHSESATVIGAGRADRTNVFRAISPSENKRVPSKTATQERPIPFRRTLLLGLAGS